ncbi:MAG: DUF1588 domain-containing protein [Myxococcota bacterium]
MKLLAVLHALVLLIGGCNGSVNGPDPSSPIDPNNPFRPVPMPEPPEPPDPNRLDPDRLFTCTSPSPLSSPSRLRRIDRLEWSRNTGGTEAGDLSRNPFDSRAQDPFTSYASSETVDLASLDLYLDIVDSAGRGWTGRNAGGSSRRELVADDSELAPMLSSDAPTDGEIRYFVTTLLKHGVVFREPTTYEVDHLVEFAKGVLASEALDGREESITRITSAAWLTYGALYRTEMGDELVDEHGRHRLTDWELAQQLAYAVGGRAPGAATYFRHPEYSAGPLGHYADIAAAAEDGSIQEAAILQALLRSNIGGTDPTRIDLHGIRGEDERAARAEEWTARGIVTFFRDWLGYGDLSAIFKDTPRATSQFESGLVDISFSNAISGSSGSEPTLTDQLDDMIGRIVVEDTDVFRQLLTSRRFYVGGNMPVGVTRPADADEDWLRANLGSTYKSTSEVHRVYNITGDVERSRAARWMTLPDTERAGVLTHPAWLVAHGGNFEDDPSAVHRGVWILEQLLCVDPPSLDDVMVDAQVGPSDPGKTARDRLLEATGPEAAGGQCAGCHGLMNPLGLPFEIYNHAGFLRADDHGRAPDGSATLVSLPDESLNGPVRDAVDMMERFAESSHVQRCFTRQVFRHFMGRGETVDDACTLVAMEDAYDANGGSLISMVEALVTSDTFLYRHLEETEGQ